MGEVSQKKEETATKPEGEKKPVNVTVMKLDMHCEGCGKKIKRILKKHKGIYSHLSLYIYEFMVAYLVLNHS